MTDIYYYKDEFLTDFPNRNDQFDVAFIGSGVAAMSGACYLAGEGLRVLVIEEKHVIGGSLATTPRVDNVFGCFGKTGVEISDDLAKQFRYFNKQNPGSAITLVDASVFATLNAYPRIDVRVNGEEMPIYPHKIVVATGLSWDSADFFQRYPAINNFHVYYGPSVCKKEVVNFETLRKPVVVGGGNSAAQAALFYAGHGIDVTMLVRSGLNTSEYLREQIIKSEHVSIADIKGISIERDSLSEYAIYDSLGHRMATGTHFIYAGSSRPNTGMIHPDYLDENYFIKTDGRYRINGHMYAIGDVRSGNPRRAAVAIGDGARIATIIHEDMKTGKHPRSTYE